MIVRLLAPWVRYGVTMHLYEFEVELQTYRDLRSALIAEGKSGRFCVVRGTEYLGDHSTEREAFQTGWTLTKGAAFLVQQIARPPHHRIRFPVVIRHDPATGLTETVTTIGVLDTGAERSCLPADVAAQLRLPQVGVGISAGIHDSRDTCALVWGRLDFGGGVVFDQKFVVVSGDEVLIGMDVIQQAHVTLAFGQCEFLTPLRQIPASAVQSRPWPPPLPPVRRAAGGGPRPPTSRAGGGRTDSVAGRGSGA